MCTWWQKKEIYKLFLQLKEETFQAFMSSWEFGREAGGAEGEAMPALGRHRVIIVFAYLAFF